MTGDLSTTDTLAEALEWYAERRNYVPAAPPAVALPEHLMATDAWDGEGPGARARAALARLRQDSSAAGTELRDALRAFDDKWYPQLAGTALGEKQLGHHQSAERWGELCRDFRALAADADTPKAEL